MSKGGAHCSAPFLFYLLTSFHPAPSTVALLLHLIEGVVAQQPWDTGGTDGELLAEKATLMQSDESVQNGSSFVKLAQVRPAKVVSLEAPAARVQQQV